MKRNLSIAAKFRMNTLVRSQFVPIFFFSRKTFVVTKTEKRIRMKYEIELTTNWRRGNKLLANKYFTKIKIREKFEFSNSKKV